MTILGLGEDHGQISLLIGKLLSLRRLQGSGAKGLAKVLLVVLIKQGRLT